MLTKMGSIAYLTKCKARVGYLREHASNCTQEIPIQYNNQSLFVDPLTRIITPIPTVVACDRVTPIAWKIEESPGKVTWLCSFPEIVKCEGANLKLEPTADDNNFFYDFSKGKIYI